MRMLIKDPVYMTYKEIKEEFYGKWILITNCKFDPYRDLLGGVPVAVADTVFEGQRDGFYDKFKAPEYAPRTNLNLDYDSLPGLMGIYEVSESDGDSDTRNL